MINVFATNTVAWANEMNANFVEVATGNLIPMADVSTTSDRVYNLGSDSYRWQKLYNADLLDADYVENTKHMYFFINNTTASADLEIDIDDYTFIEFNVQANYNTVSSENFIEIGFVGVTTPAYTSKYSCLFYDLDPGTGRSTVATYSDFSFRIGYVSTNSTNWAGRGLMILKSGNIRHGYCHGCDDNDVGGYFSFSINSGTSNTITAIQIDMDATVSMTSFFGYFWGNK